MQAHAVALLEAAYIIHSFICVQLGTESKEQMETKEAELQVR